PARERTGGRQAMATPEHAHAGRGNATATAIATNRWGPYSGAGDFAGNMAIILASLLAALALALALHAGVRCLLRRRRQRPAVAEPAPPPPLPPLLVYSASGTRLAGAAAHECAICLAEFADGDAVRAMPACGHGFHARCIERWLAVPTSAAGSRRPSCPTCRAPAAPP
uniref:RING-type domain-containing protein n=1 Tax=Aegilops tauschii subsp. strangulata TaxID=200361 RepID=A0A453MS55_AEGTS